jgi:hypothetical protein
MKVAFRDSNCSLTLYMLTIIRPPVPLENPHRLLVCRGTSRAHHFITFRYEVPSTIIILAPSFFIISKVSKAQKAVTTIKGILRSTAAKDKHGKHS